jgi:hypothetical protein
MICNTVTTGRFPALFCRFLPYSNGTKPAKSSWQIMRTSATMHRTARHYMKTELSFGYACYKDDIA